uniref:Uncharacterized protein n=1 Tax=Anguilla anguilla TaxID=7936 RepID=A0A0E9XNV7_ANGAN
MGPEHLCLLIQWDGALRCLSQSRPRCQMLPVTLCMNVISPFLFGPRVSRPIG